MSFNYNITYSIFFFSLSFFLKFLGFFIGLVLFFCYFGRFQSLIVNCLEILSSYSLWEQINPNILYFEKVLLDNMIISLDLDTRSNCSIVAKSDVLVVLLRSQTWVHSLLHGKGNLLTLSCGKVQLSCKCSNTRRVTDLCLKTPDSPIVCVCCVRSSILSYSL